MDNPQTQRSSKIQDSQLLITFQTRARVEMLFGTSDYPYQLSLAAGILEVSLLLKEG
jgi:hypothetical protein